MSLVGNLADLGLGDILQIISLSQKSGTLQLATPTDSGAIGFVQGKVVAAVREHSGVTVAELLIEGHLLTATQLQEMLALQLSKPTGAASQPPLLWEAFKLAIDPIEQAFKKHLEQLVFEMFDWDEGNFSFAVADDPREVGRLKLQGNVFTVMRGLNPQYLAIEGSRLRDEKHRNDPFQTFMQRDGGPQPARAKQRGPEEIQQSAEKLAAPPPPAPLPQAVLPPAPLPPALLPPPSLPVVSQSPPPPAAPRPFDVVPSATGLGRAPPPAPIPRAPAPTPLRPLAQLPTTTSASAPMGVTPKAAAVVVPDAKPAGGGDEEPVPPQQMRAACEVVLIDDDPNLLRAMREKLLHIVPQVSVFTKVDAGLKRVRELLWAKRKVFVVCDLILPRSDGAGILGGLEALEKIRPDYPEVPVFLLFDYPNEEAKQRAEKLSVNGVISKPRRAELEKDRTRALLDEPVAKLQKALEPFLLEAQSEAAARGDTEPEPPENATEEGELFEHTERIAPIDRSHPVVEDEPKPADSEETFDVSFDDEPAPAASVVASPVTVAPPLIIPPPPPVVAAPPIGELIDLTGEAELIELTRDISLNLEALDGSPLEPGQDGALVVLKSLLFELMSPSSRDTVMLLVLRYAAELFSRATLLLVAREELWGLGGFSHLVKSVDFTPHVRKLRAPVEPGSSFAHVIRTRTAQKQSLNKTPGETGIAKELGMDPAAHAFIAPLLSADRVAAILLGDNQQVGKDLGDTHGLEIFLLQAGMAMERALLERRLRELGRKEG